MIARIKVGAIALLIVLAVSLFLSNYVTPDYRMIFGLKRFQENIFLKIKATPTQKVDYESAILDERLSELKYLVENQKTGYLLTSSLRYSATAGKLTEIIKQNYVFDKIPLIQAKFKSHQEIIAGLVTLCQKNDNTECKYIKDDVNYLKLYSDRLLSSD